jgi:hypothetical protein
MIAGSVTVGDGSRGEVKISSTDGLLTTVVVRVGGVVGVERLILVLITGGVKVRVTVAVARLVAVALGVAVEVAVLVTVGVDEAVAVADGVEVRVAVGVLVAVGRLVTRTIGMGVRLDKGEEMLESRRSSCPDWESNGCSRKKINTAAKTGNSKYRLKRAFGSGFITFNLNCPLGDPHYNPRPSQA